MRRLAFVAAALAVANAANLREPAAAKAIKKAAGPNIPPSWKSLPAKVHSIEDACRMNDMEPTKRQCQRSSCFQVMPKANKRYCCCASMLGGWTFDAVGNCTTDMQCPQAMPSHLVRPVPSLREQLSYNTKLSICAEHCVDACAAQGQQWKAAQHEAAGNVTADASRDALVTSLVELSTAHTVAALATDRCEDRCIESCLQTAHPSITVGAFLELHEHARRTARAEALGIDRDIAAIRAKVRELQSGHKHQATSSAGHGASKDAAAAGATTDASTGDSIVAPSYSNAPRFSSASTKAEATTRTTAQAAAHAGAAAAAQSTSAQGEGTGQGASAGSGAKWWTNPPPWWLPPPPEWGAPPPNVYSSFYSPYNAPQATPQMAMPQAGYPAAQASPLPH